MNWVIITFLAYSLICLGITLYVGKTKILNMRDYFVGGRRIGWLGTGMSYMATARSASSMLGDSGLAYLMGYPTIFLGMGMTAVEFLNMLYVGPRLRKFAERYDCTTIADYLEARFEDRARLLRGLCILTIVVFFIAYIAAQYVGMSLAFTTMFGWDALFGMVVSAAIITVYCAIGGYVADVWTDVFQGMIMIAAFIVLPLTMIYQAGGIPEIFAKLGAVDAKMVAPFGQGISFFLLVTFLGVGSLGNPHLLIRFVSAGSTDALRKGAYVSLVANLIMRWGAIFTGLAGRALWPQLKDLMVSDREMVFFTGATRFLPPVVVGILVAAVVAAVMSTVDSQLVMLSSAVIRDFYDRILGRGVNLSTERYLAVGRWCTVITGFLALMFAIYAKAGVFTIVSFAWGGLGAAFGPAVILSVFWKRMTRTGALTGMLLAFLITICWRLTPALKAIVYEAVPAVVIGTAAILIVSLMTAPPETAKVDEDFAATRPRYRHR